jgi:hypothetical protein
MKSLGKWGVWMLTAIVVMSAAMSVAMMADDDPPSRVARMQYMSGQVSLQPGGVNDWVPGVLNRPLTTADRVWTDKESRAELDLGSAALRAGAETSMTLTNVNDLTVQVELDQGTLDLRVRRLYDGEVYEIDTPNLAFTVLRAGEYRVDVDSNGDLTVVTVWHGMGEATGDGRSVRIKGDHQARFINGTSLTHQMTDDPERDGFDDWCRVRDRREEESVSARYVSPDVIGAEDLDRYGRWQTTPSYGAMWVPAVAPGWAPYHYGHWAWIEPWGWTWVDDAPWGFAPFHYGRWVYDGGYWGWVPGPRVVRPVYAPALVAWVGGGGVSVGISIGEAPTVGWFPLGYGEPYLPPYAGSRNYFRQVNVSNTRITNITQVTNNYYVNNSNTTINRTTVINNNTTNIANNNTTIVNNNVHNNFHNNVHIRYANEKVPGAVTAVPATALASSQPVAKAAVRVPPGQWKRAEVGVAPPVAPSRQSVLGVRAGAPAVAPPARVMTRQVVMKRPAPPRPVPFSVKQEALQHNPGRPLDRDTEQALRTRVARQQVNQPGRVAQQEQFGGRPGNAQPMANPPQSRQPMPQADRGFRGTPPARQEVQQQAAPAAGRGVPHPPENRPAESGEQMAPAYRQVPRPPQQNNGQQPGFRSFGSPQGETRAVPQPPQQGNRPQVGAPQNESRPVPQPSQQRNQEQPGFRSFGSPQGRPHSVPQPPANAAAGERNGRGMENAGSQPRYQGNQPNAGPASSGRNDSAPVARPSNPRPSPEPARTERPAPRPQPTPSSGRAVQSRESSPPPQHGKQESKDESNNKDKRH